MNKLEKNPFSKIRELHTFRKHRHIRLLHTNKLRRDLAIDVIQRYAEQNGILPTYRELCIALRLSGSKQLLSLIREMELLNYITVVNGKNGQKMSRHLMINKSIKVPVFQTTNMNEVIDYTTVDTRLFKRPPHYALKFYQQEPLVGSSGALAMVHTPIDVSGKNVVVEHVSGLVTLMERHFVGLQKPKFKHPLDGIIVGSIFQINN